MLRNHINVKVASVLMGHASVAFTLDTYSHLLPDDTADVGEKVATAMLSR
jgi:integrase